MQGSVPSAIGSRHTAIRYLQSHDCIDKLKRNMREEHVLKLDWISTLFKHVSYTVGFFVAVFSLAVSLLTSANYQMVALCCFAHAE